MTIQLAENDAMGRALNIMQEKAFEQGKAAATAISLGYSNYGATDSAIVAVPFEGFLDLRRQIRSRRWRRYGDNPGQAFMGSCKLVMLHKGDDNVRIAVMLVSTSYDV